ncbi:MAG: V-type ATPase 116kDa subunit family protein [Pyrobaculum sp.]
MPLEKIVEFRVAGGIDLLPDVIYFVGKTGAAMFETRPERLPKPRDPHFLQKVRRIDEILGQIAPYIQPREVKLPLAPLESQVGQVLEKLESIRREVSYYARLADELKSKLAISRELAKLKTTTTPKIETLDVYIVLPGRWLKEALELCKSYGASAVQHEGVLIVATERQTQLRTSLEKLGALVLTPGEVEEVEPPHALEERLKKVETELKTSLSRHEEAINYAYTLRNAISTVIDTLNRSAIDEGLEVGRLFETYEKEIKRLERQVDDLRKIKLVLEGLRENVKLPQGFKLVVDPQLPIEAPHVLQEVNGIKVALVRGEARGVEIPAEYLSDVKTGLRLVEDAIKSTEVSTRRLKRELEAIEKAYAQYSTYGDKRWEERRDTASVVFYVLERDAGKVDDALVEFVKHHTGEIEVVRRLRYKYFDRVPAERRPTLERLPPPIRQFTKVTYMYGVPKPVEISPTALVAIIFPIFFGWMYGDLGHGFLLFLLGLLLVKKLYGGKHRDWGVIWATTGVASMLFGLFVYQEAFGIHLKELGIKLPPPIFPIFGEKELVEVEGITATVRAAFLLGFLLMLMAFFTKFVNTWLKGERDMALAVILPQTAMFLSFSMLFFSLIKEGLGLGFLNPILQLPWAFILAASLLWSIAGMLAIRAKYRHHEEKPPATEEFILGFVESAIGAFANIPSFSRLVILILIHGTLTKLVNGAAAAVGMPLGLIPAVLGQALIATAEAFFSLVQTLRLTFYEVLSKFYEGRGRLFTPLTLP